MKNFTKWMLGAVVLAGGLSLGATSAQAAQVRVFVGGGPVAYAPPCPGPGYAWVAGYYNDGYWVPGYWNYVGAGYGYYGRDDDDYGHRGYYNGGFWRHDDDDHDGGYGRGFYGRGRWDDHHDGGRWHR
jgi:hypothetical protein